MRFSIPPRNRGAAAIEFACTLPLLLLLALGACDFGRITYYHQYVTAAAATGAVRGATQQFTEFAQGVWQESVEESVVEAMSQIPEFDAGELVVDITTTAGSNGLVLVNVDVSYPFRTAVSWPLLPNEITLRHRSTFGQFR
jgi:Flp pilus assembly protein TadG